MRSLCLCAPAILAIYLPFCTPNVHPTMPSEEADKHLVELWQPRDVAAQDLFKGPWSDKHAPDPSAVYTLVREKTHGASPGMTVRDPAGVEWSVKQGAEGPIEVVLSRTLSAIGYHQPPVYYLPSFLLDHNTWVERAPGGRFRPHVKGLKDAGFWSWQENPFVGTRPYQGLLVALLMLNSSDIKNTNNTLYELNEAREGTTRWYVVRDIGTALGETAKLAPERGDPNLFEKNGSIKGVRNGFVQFDYRGWHQELIRDRITPADVGWAADLLGELSDAQWSDAFRAGGYQPEVANRFIQRIKAKIDEGHSVAAGDHP